MVCKRGTTGRESVQLTAAADRTAASKQRVHTCHNNMAVSQPFLQSLQPLSSFFPLLEWQTQRGDAPGPSQAQAAEPHHHIARVWPRQATTDSPILHIAGKFSICTRWQTEPAHRRHCQPSVPDGTNQHSRIIVNHLHQMALTCSQQAMSLICTRWQTEPAYHRP